MEEDSNSPSKRQLSDVDMADVEPDHIGTDSPALRRSTRVQRKPKVSVAISAQIPAKTSATEGRTPKKRGGNAAAKKEKASAAGEPAEEDEEVQQEHEVDDEEEEEEEREEDGPIEDETEEPEEEDEESDASVVKRATKKKKMGSKGTPASTTRGRRKSTKDKVTNQRGRSKSQGRKKKAATTPAEDDEEGDDDGETSIFEIVINHPNALESTVNDWMASYHEDRVAAMVELVNFLIESSGCPGKINKDVLEDQDEIPKAFEELQSQFDPATHHEYPLVAKGRGRGGANKFRKAFGEFWTKWINKLKSTGIIHGEEGWCMDTLAVWLMTMSSSVFRPFRHTATATALIILTGLCEILRKILSDWTTANRQLTTEQEKGSGSRSGGRKGPREKQLEETVGELHSKKMRIDGHLQDLFEAVFVHRYRDVDPTIRMECIRELGLWIAKLPDTFLDPGYLRYEGWMLSDKHPTVRQEALRALSQLYAVETTASGLRTFTDRFKGRLIEMACRDAAVRTDAVNVLIKAGDVGFLDDEDRALLVPLIFDTEPQLRGLVAELVALVWEQEYMEPMLDDARTRMTGGEEVDEKWIELKALCQMLVRHYHDIPEDGRKEEVQKSKKEPLLISEYLSHSLGLYRSQSQSPSQAAEDTDELDDEEMLLDETELQKRRKQEREVFEWMARFDDTGASSTGAQSVGVAVNALWEHIAVLKDWKAICDYLSQDLSSTTPDSGASASLGDQSNDSDNIYGLSDEEETCLTYILRAAIERTLSSSDTDEVGKKKGRKMEDVKMDVSQGLIKYLPKLFKKYGSEYAGIGKRRIIEVVGLVRFVDVGVYLELRMLKAYDALFEDLKKVFLKHGDHDVLSECCQTFRYLMGSHQKPKTTASTPARSGRKKKAAASSSDTEEGDDTSAASLYVATAQKIEELSEEIATVQLADQLKEVTDIVDSEEELDLELLYGLRNAATRLEELWLVVDLGNVMSDEVIKGGEGVEWASLFELQNGVMETMLRILTREGEKNKGKGKGPAEESEPSELVKVVNDVMEPALRILQLDVSWELRRACVALSPEVAGVSPEIEETDAQPPVPDVEFSKEQLDMYVKPYSEKSARLASILEAIVAGDPEEAIEYGLQFSMGVKLTALKLLMFLYMQSESTVKDVLGIANNDPDGSVQTQTLQIIAKAVEVLEFGKRKAVPELSKARVATEAARHEILKLVADVVKLVQTGQFEPVGVTPLLCGYYGFETDQDVAPAKPVIHLLGTVWDGLAEAFLREIVVHRVQRFVDPAQSEDKKTSKEQTLTGFTQAIVASCNVVFEGLKQSMDLYYSLKSASLNPSLSLEKVIVTVLKTWISLLPAADRRARGPIVVENLLLMLRCAVDHMVDIVSSWSAAHGGAGRASGVDEEAIDVDFEILEVKRESLEEVNAGWRVWGGVGGVVQQIVHSVGGTIAKREDSDVDITTVEDIVEYVSQRLLARGFKPAETDKEWDGYWSFVRALEKGDATIRKKIRKPKPEPSSKQGTPKRKRGTRTPKKSGLASKYASEEEESDRDGAVTPTPKAKRVKTGRKKADDDTVSYRTPAKSAKKRKARSDTEDEGSGTVTPSRRSARTKAKVKYVEASDEEEDAEDDMVEVRWSTPKRPKLAHSSFASKAMQQDEGGEEDEEEEEEEELIPTRRKGKNVVGGMAAPTTPKPRQVYGKSPAAGRVISEDKENGGAENEDEEEEGGIRSPVRRVAKTSVGVKRKSQIREDKDGDDDEGGGKGEEEEEMEASEEAVPVASKRRGRSRKA